MSHKSMVLGALLTLTLTVPAFADEPVKGDIFELTWDAAYKGWKNFSSSTGDDGQPYTVFENQNQYLITGTETIRADDGQKSIQRVLFSQKLVLGENERAEEGGDCGFLGNYPAIAVFNTKTKTATGYWVFKNEVVTRRWLVDDPDLCSYGGD